MKVFSIFGITKSGKTTTVENIVTELRKRRYTVGSVKEIHYEEFTIDEEGTNTDRHKKSGSQLVTARGFYETDVLFQEKLSIEKILSFYDHDYVVLEGATDCNVPKIVTAHTIDEIEERLDNSVFAISGVISEELTEYKGIPVIHPIKQINELVDLIEEKVFEKLPEFPEKCCNSCGYSCTELCSKILKGEAKRSDCMISNKKINLIIDGKEIDMVPFVQNILYNSVQGVVEELEGYRKNAKIEIKIGE